MKRLLGVGVGVVLCLVMTACGGSKPEGFPDNLVPVTVTVTNADGPVEGVRVALTDKSGSIVMGCVTDAMGVAKVRTQLANYSEEGVVAGEYKVTVQKEPHVEDTWKPEDYNKDKAAADKHSAEIRAAEAKLPKIVPIALTKLGTTPLTVSVTTEPVELAVDLTAY